ncbi:MAG: acylphosphatase [Deltaproteobacteria bacterium HGW-Deltaproteobacteria-12]|jgi:acylphosphatase|nr:MAG: acylphosphatase [Deltaproteobacteria bacterium HGW-Deltaproteobacteria-12]
MKRVHVYISGYVQGVCFRAATRRAAADRNLTGWVRNTDDGRVEALFEGEDLQIDKMLAWCQDGPPAARVKKVTTLEEQYTGGFTDFSIRY